MHGTHRRGKKFSQAGTTGEGLCLTNLIGLGSPNQAAGHDSGGFIGSTSELLVPAQTPKQNVDDTVTPASIIQIERESGGKEAGVPNSAKGSTEKTDKQTW